MKGGDIQAVPELRNIVKGSMPCASQPARFDYFDQCRSLQRVLSAVQMSCSRMNQPLAQSSCCVVVSFIIHRGFTDTGPFFDLTNTFSARPDNVLSGHC
jgi:hypothetical protein